MRTIIHTIKASEIYSIQIMVVVCKPSLCSWLEEDTLSLSVWKKSIDKDRKRSKSSIEAEISTIRANKSYLRWSNASLILIHDCRFWAIEMSIKISSFCCFFDREKNFFIAANFPPFFSLSSSTSSFLVSCARFERWEEEDDGLMMIVSVEWPLLWSARRGRW